MAAIMTTISTPIAITEEKIMNKLSKNGFRETIYDKEYLFRIQQEVEKLQPSNVKLLYPASFLFSGLLYFDNLEEGLYLSFTGYEGKYYMYYNKKLYEWNQDLANIIYEKLPERIMGTVYNDIK